MEKESKVRCLFCKGAGKKGGKTCPKCKGKKKLKLVFAPQEEIDRLGPYVDRVVDAIQKVLKIKGVWVSDESRIGDFLEIGGDHKKTIEKISKKLKIPVGRGDTIVDVAKRLREKEWAG